MSHPNFMTVTVRPESWPKYDAKVLRDALNAQLAFDAAIKRELCGLYGCADVHDLPDAIKDMDLGIPWRTVARRRRLSPAARCAASPLPPHRF